MAKGASLSDIATNDTSRILSTLRLNNTIIKLRNRLNKDTFEKISYLKSWGVFKEELEEVKKEEKTSENLISEEDN